jgi:hypothetical protein
MLTQIPFLRSPFSSLLCVSLLWGGRGGDGNGLWVNADSMTWQSVASLPAEGRHHPITFANETHGFLLTGTTAANSFTSDMYLYDPSTDTWAALESDLPLLPRSYSYGIVLPVPNHTKAYLGFGSSLDPVALGDWWEFDMRTLQWKQLADFPGVARRHPAMNVVQATKSSGDSGGWEIHVGLGDGLIGNLNDWWAYTIATGTWRQLPAFPSSKRHHPFFFGIGSTSYAGMGHSSGLIEQDWYSIKDEVWTRLPNFSSTSLDDQDSIITAEARVAGTQFAITLNGKSLGFVLSGDGDDHRSMSTGEFHAFVPESGGWEALPPHPGLSRWAPGSFVLRGTSQVYFVGGFDRTTGVLHNDMWKIDVKDLFLESENEAEEDVVAADGNDVEPGPQTADPTGAPVGSTSGALSPTRMVLRSMGIAAWVGVMFIAN